MKAINDTKTHLWYGYERLAPLLKAYAPNVQLFMPVLKLQGLELQLNNIIEDGQYFIPLNINCLSQKFEEGQNNHWVGLYVIKSFDQVAGVIYIDPMGKKIDPEVSAITRNLLNIGSIGEPLLGSPVQYVQLDSSGTFIEEGNDNDCGPFLVYCLASIVSGKKIRQDIETPEQAISFGHYLRDAFSKETRLEEIYQTITTNSKKENAYEGYTTTTIKEIKNNKTSNTSILEDEQELNESIAALEEKLFPGWHLGKGHELPNSEDEKSKIFLEIQTSYEAGLEAYQAGNLKLAEQEFIKALRPVLSKPSMKSLYVNVEEVRDKLLDSVYHLGLIYRDNTTYFEHHAKAAAIFQYCAEFARKYKIGIVDNFLKQAFEMETRFLSSIDKSDMTSSTSVIMEKATTYKAEVKRIRDGVKKQLTDIKDFTIEQIAERTKAIEKIYGYSSSFFVSQEGEGNETNETSGMVQRLIMDCQQQLGAAPEGCEYTIISLGSLAGGKMTPYSDLEFAILIKKDKEEYKEYFRNLTKLLHIKIINFGETMLRGMGIEAFNNFKTGQVQDDWFWDSTIMKSGFSFDGSHPHACKSPLGRHGGYKDLKDFELILTPEQLADFQKEEDWFKSDKHLVQALRTVSLITGSQSLLDDYRQKIKGAETLEFQATLQARSLEILLEDVNKFSLKLGEEEEGKLLDTKKDIYRLGDRVIDALANYYAVEPELGQAGLTAWEIIRTMKERGILSEEGAQHLQEALSIAAELRLRTYCHNEGQQKETMSTTELIVEHLNEEQRKHLVEETFYLKDITILHHFYYVMLRVQELVQAFCDQEDHNLSEFMLQFDQLFNDSNYNKGMVSARFLEYKQAVQYLEDAKEQRPNDLQILRGLLSLCNRTGIIEKAISTGNELLGLEIDKYRDNPNHPNLARSYNDLGRAYRNKGEYDEATKYYNRSLEIYLKIYEKNPDHPFIAGIYNNLGNAYCKQEKYDEAIKHCNLALNILLKTYEATPNSPFIAACYNNLGEAYRNKGKYDKALECYNQALNVWLRAYELVPNHPSIAMSYNNLGTVYSEKEEYDEAIKYYNLALDIKLKAYKFIPNHPSIAMSYNNLGEAYKNKGEYEETIKYCELGLNIQLKVYESNPHHPDILMSYRNLGDAYYNKREYDQAIMYYRLVLDIWRNTSESDPNHPDIAVINNNLGNAYCNKGEYDQAIEYHNLALDIQRKTYGPSSNHSNIASSYNNLGNAHSNKGQYDEAIRNYKAALKVQSEIYKNNPNHRDIAGTYNNLAGTYADNGQYDEAIRCYKLGLDIHLKGFKSDPNPAILANIYNGLGTSYAEKEEYGEALKYYNLALNMWLKVHESSPRHVDVAISYNNLAGLCLAQKKYAKAVLYSHTAHDIYLEIYESSPNHPALLKNRYNLGMAIQENQNQISRICSYHSGEGYFHFLLKYLQQGISVTSEQLSEVKEAYNLYNNISPTHRKSSFEEFFTLYPYEDNPDFFMGDIKQALHYS